MVHLAITRMWGLVLFSLYICIAELVFGKTISEVICHVAVYDRIRVLHHDTAFNIGLSSSEPHLVK